MLWTPGQPIRVVAVPVAATALSAPIFGRGCWLMGYLLTEAAGAAASVVLVSGADATGAQLVPLDLAANETKAHSMPGPGLPFDGGAFLLVTAGSVKGSVSLGVAP